MSNDVIVISDRYASALIILSEETNNSDKILQDLMSIRDAIESHNELRGLLLNPGIFYVEKQEAVKDLFQNHIDELTMNFLYLLLEKNRLNVLETIIEKFKILLNEKRNVIVASVTTPILMSKELVNRLKEKLASIFKKEIHLKEQVNPEIITGAIVQIGDKVIDGSLLGRFEKMKKLIY